MTLSLMVAVSQPVQRKGAHLGRQGHDRHRALAPRGVMTGGPAKAMELSQEARVLLEAWSRARAGKTHRAAFD